MSTMIVTIFVASLAGSLHCAGMCGAFMLFAVGAGENNRTHVWRLHLAYHLGRLVTYVVLGTLAGIAGATVEWGGDLVGVQRAAAIGAALFMIVMGIVMLVRSRGARVPHMPVPKVMRTMAARGYKTIGNRAPLVRAAGTGLLTTLLPCGWLYMFVVAAAGTGDPLSAAMTMVVFWMGTLPVLVALAAGARSILGPLAHRAPMLAACSIIVVGLLTVFNRSVLIVRTPDMLRSLSQEQGSVLEAGLTGTPACCDDDS